MTVGQRVVITKAVEWGSAKATSAPPPIGLAGVVADPDEFPYPTPPRGRTAVIFQARDLGYIPHDEDHETLCYYIPTKCLETA